MTKRVTLRQAEVLRDGVDLGSRHLQIEPVFDGCLLHVRKFVGSFREVGQSIRQHDRRLLAPQAEALQQIFASAHLVQSRSCQTLGGIRVESLLTRLVEPVPVARLHHLAGEVCARLRRGLDLLHVTQRLVGRDRAVVRLARFVGELQHFDRDVALHLNETASLDFERQRHDREREHVDQQGLLDGELAAGARMSQNEQGIGDPPGLHHVRFGDSEFLERCLQSAVVQQGDSYGVVGRQRMTEKRLDLLVDRALLVGRADPLEIDAGPFLGGLRDRVEAAVPGERGATADG